MCSFPFEGGQHWRHGFGSGVVLGVGDNHNDSFHCPYSPARIGRVLEELHFLQKIDPHHAIEKFQSEAEVGGALSLLDGLNRLCRIFSRREAVKVEEEPGLVTEGRRRYADILEGLPGKEEGLQQRRL